MYKPCPVCGMQTPPDQRLCNKHQAENEADYAAFQAAHPEIYDEHRS